MAKFGETSWEAPLSGSKNSNSKDVFLKLEKGDNELRIITEPYEYQIHKVKKDENDKKDFGQKVTCSGSLGACPLCAAGNKSKSQWLFGTICRKTGTYRILDVSYAIFSQIKKLAQNTKRWGSPKNYDINIVVDPDGGASSYYSVQPVSKEPLSAADQVIRDAVDHEDLKRRSSEFTPEQVQKRADYIMNGVSKQFDKKDGAKPVQATPAPSAVKTTKVTKPPVVEEDDSFPPYEGE